MEVKICATNPATRPSPQAMYGDEWRISETNLVPIAGAICGVKTKHSRIEPVETHDESVTSY
jgi:hypothetical protein